eukprot:CAMPEP_0175184378 /NCGR_PEP_ID=MMETSP0093-20121207/1334_1 /TAXON_ID=311494 /ORGANISM="Alexandrium monilatum, Strain CCMP3105" /LENGTH=185 /DNA_ID=CAMNT_0016477045 /DNA_START=302 /DNA_END=861 /DNA_ORIENTATION=-
MTAGSVSTFASSGGQPATYIGPEAEAMFTIRPVEGQSSGRKASETFLARRCSPQACPPLTTKAHASVVDNAIQGRWIRAKLRCDVLRSCCHGGILRCVDAQQLNPPVTLRRLLEDRSDGLLPPSRVSGAKQHMKALVPAELLAKGQANPLVAARDEDAAEGHCHGTWAFSSWQQRNTPKATGANE